MTKSATRLDSRRELRADARRNRELIFAAARRCFSDKATSTSMEEIAQQAGVGVGSLYRAFGNKSGLAEAIFRDAMDQLVTQADQLATSDDPFRALHEWLAGYVRQILAKRTMLSELQPLFDKDPELVESSRAAVVSALRVVLRPAQQAKAVRDDITEVELMALVNGSLLPGMTDPGRALQLLGVILDGMLSKGASEKRTAAATKPNVNKSARKNPVQSRRT